MENFNQEIFSCTELTEEVAVPVLWADHKPWDDAADRTDFMTVRGILEREYLGLDLGIAGQDSSNPRLLIQTAGIPNARQGDTVTVDGVTYAVGTPMPDHLGTTTLDLVLTST